MAPVSFRHEAVQRLRRLADRKSDRWESRSFVVEGSKVLEEALWAGAAIGSVFVDTEGATAADRDLASRCEAGGARIIETQPGVLARVCDVVTPQPLVAALEMVDVPLEQLSMAAGGPAPAAPLVVCVGVQDPGNAGTILRSARAAGTRGVVFCENSVDVFNPKVVRASAGALFNVPVVVAGEVRRVLEEVRRWGLGCFAAIGSGGRPHDSVDLTSPAALVFGNEAHGLPAALDEHLDGRITIPMTGGTESLNVAMAATVLLFEAARQRRQLT